MNFCEGVFPDEVRMKCGGCRMQCTYAVAKRERLEARLKETIEQAEKKGGQTPGFLVISYKTMRSLVPQGSSYGEHIRFIPGLVLTSAGRRLGIILDSRVGEGEFIFLDKKRRYLVLNR